MAVSIARQAASLCSPSAFTWIPLYTYGKLRAMERTFHWKWSLSRPCLPSHGFTRSIHGTAALPCVYGSSRDTSGCSDIPRCSHTPQHSRTTLACGNGW